MAKPFLWLDTNVAWSPTRVRQICTLARRKGIPVVVHAQVHLEIWRQRVIKDGSKFSPQMMESFLETNDIRVRALTQDQETSEKWGAILAERFPDDRDWKHAKLSSVRARLPDDAAVSLADVPMTTDWLIALAVETDGGYVAVEDKGAEWDALRATEPKRAMSYEETLIWLASREDAPEED